MSTTQQQDSAMSTPCFIAVELKDGSVREVYCHYDGYVQYMRKMLTQHYNTQELAEMLTSMGDLSCVKPRFIPSTPNHTFAKPEEGVTIVYNRDRGENTEPTIYWNFEMYQLHRGKKNYSYIFRNGQWF